MSFDSIFFISCFLPPVIILNFILKSSRARNIMLLAAGLVFCAFGQLSSVAVLILAALFNYALGCGLCSSGKKALLIFGIIVDIGFLGAYKYLDFIFSGFCGIAGREFEGFGIVAPIGISFFTFRCISYIIDVYRKPESRADSFFDFMLYISFFPQLLAGPISRFSDFSACLHDRRVSVELCEKGIERYIIGLGKKILLSASAASVADAVFAMKAAELDAGFAWLGAACYTLQIFFDFAGYSDMAIGLGLIFGFETPENFDYPYISLSITEFWRRWHISLSSWFKDYLYIPLGGNRKGKKRAALNKFIVFTLCGIWHGAAWTFVLWGVWHGIFSALESLRIIDTKKLSSKAAGRIFLRIYTLLAVCLGFVLFRADSVGAALTLFRIMFTGFAAIPASTVCMHRVLTGETMFFLALSLLFSTPVMKLEGVKRLSEKVAAFKVPMCSVLFAFCVVKLASGGFTPFIYFQF